MNSVEAYVGLKIIHLSALIFWLGPSLGGWLLLMLLRKREGEFNSATQLGYRLFIKLLLLEHVAFAALLGTGLTLAWNFFGFQQSWLQWKLLLIITLIIPLEIFDIWYGNVKLPRIFASPTLTGYTQAQSRQLHIYHRYITGAAIAIIPLTLLAIMYLVVAKPALSQLWQLGQ